MKTVLAVVAAFAVATPAFANPTENPFAKDQTILNLAGLDLSTTDGQQRLAIRIDNAARAVCGDRVATVHIALEEQARACRAEVVANVRNQIEGRSASASTGAAVGLASLR